MRFSSIPKMKVCLYKVTTESGCLARSILSVGAVSESERFSIPEDHLMSGRSLSMAALAVLIGAGCSNVKTEKKIQEAADLVQQKTGNRPEWSVPWDENAHAWDSKTVLTEQDTLTAALRNNRMLRADLEMIGQANADLLQAGLFMNPVLNFMVMFPDGGGRSMLRSNGLPMMPLQDLWMIPARRKASTASSTNTGSRS